MEEESPSCKRSRRSNDDAGDRLSALPDCLLHEIMSRLQARQVVQTCVLSARWRHLWRSVPCFDADQREFGFGGAAAAAAAHWSVAAAEASWDKFEDFMDILLSPGNVSIASLDSFRLHVASHYTLDEKRGYRWVRRAMKLFGGGGAAHGFGIRRQGLSSTSTTTTRSRWPSWRLRKLQLDNVSLDALFSEHVGSSGRCPNLEDLELTGCRCAFRAITVTSGGSLRSLAMKGCRMVGVREITSTTLNSLVIDGCINTSAGGDCPLVITAPAAASVFLGLGSASHFPGGFSVREMTKPLAKASLRLRATSTASSNCLILGRVSDVVTNLELTDSQAMVADEWSATFPQFNKLRALELNRCDLSNGFQMLGLFLRNSPNLERLTLRHCKYSNDSKNNRRSSKSKNKEPTTPCPNLLLGAQCKNLLIMEIIYRDEDIRELIELLLCISENLPNTCIKLTKI